MKQSEYSVSPILRSDCAEYILEIHYARRWPSISYAFGLYRSGVLCGIVTYGTPPSAPLRSGIAGPKFAPSVIELNRLCLLDNVKNEASMLVGRSIRMLPKDKIIVSFADIAYGHNGYVYQASNFLYCGLSAKRTDWKIRGKEHLHGQTVADEFRGVESRVLAMRDKYGDDFYLAPRSRKHRYLYVLGSKRFRRAVMENLRYSIEAYPKQRSLL